MSWRLADLRLLRSDQELELLKCHLSDVQAQHAANAYQRVREEDRQRRREADRRLAEQRLERLNKAATCIQAALRSWRARRHDLPGFLQRRREELLLQSKSTLKDKFHAMNLALHSLTFTNEDRLTAVFRIQAWWRSVLAIRVTRILLIRSRVAEAHKTITMSAARIQARWRGLLARRRTAVQLRERELRRQQSQREWQAKRLFAALKLQSQFRARVEFRQMLQKKVRAAAGLDGDSADGEDITAFAVVQVESKRGAKKASKKANPEPKRTTSHKKTDLLLPKKSMD